MKVPAKLHFVTLQTQRTEQTANGYVITGSEGVRMGYTADDYAWEVCVSGDVATVTRRGDCAYTLTLSENTTAFMEVNGLRVPVDTQKIRFIHEAHSARFMARYTVGKEPTTVIVRAEY